MRESLRVVIAHHDCCVYHNKSDDGSMIYLLLYVNGILIAAKSKSNIQKLNDFFSAKFEMKDLPTTQFFLGMEIYREIDLNKLFFRL